MSLRRCVLLATILTTGALAGCVEQADGYAGDVTAVMNGNMSIMELARKVVTHELNPNAQLIVKQVDVKHEMNASMGETLEADPGYAFHHVRVRVINNGSMDLSVSTWQFSSVDETGSETGAETEMAHQDFDASRIRAGAIREGTVIFEMPEDANLTAVVWRGTLAEARGEVPAPAEKPA